MVATSFLPVLVILAEAVGRIRDLGRTGPTATRHAQRRRDGVTDVGLDRGIGASVSVGSA